MMEDFRPLSEEQSRGACTLKLDKPDAAGTRASTSAHVTAQASRAVMLLRMSMEIL